MADLPKVICLMGPTAVGKTDLAFELAEHLDVEIINVDSALIYKKMDIGTAKPSYDELKKVKHHLIDMIDPNESYSVAQFYNDAMASIDKVHDAGKTPLCVGGTMMYFNRLEHGLTDLPEANPVVREQIIREKGQLGGWNELYKKLEEIDPIGAVKIKSMDQQRIIRALEVYYITGKCITEHHQNAQKNVPRYYFRHCSILPEERSQLHQRIEDRFNLMLRRGLVDEVEALIKRYDLDLSMPSMRMVGYRQVFQYLNGQLSYDEMKFKGVVATRGLAKRQMTWLRHSFPLAKKINMNPNHKDLQRLLDFFTLDPPS